MPMYSVGYIIDRLLFCLRDSVTFSNFKLCIGCNLFYSGADASQIEEDDIPESIIDIHKENIKKFQR